MLDRTQAPPIHQIRNISLPEIETHPLNAGRKLYIHREKNTQAFKIEVLCNAGNISAANAAQVQLGLKMLNEGTKGKTGHQVSEYIDSLGSFLEIAPGFDHSSISIYGLKKYFKENIKVLSEIVYQPSFNNEAYTSLKEREKNKLKMNLEKGAYLSSVNLRKILFENHPYGYTQSIEEIDRLQIEEVISFHQYIKSFDIYLAGDIPEDAVQVVQEYFNENFPSDEDYELADTIPEGKNIEVRDAKYIQSSIKLGRRLFNRSHPDYFKFIVTNELLGGFFGSRLMKNIREDKGYTYGIYSSLYPLKHGGYFIISTDVKGENEKDTLGEINKEIDLVNSELVLEDELEVVKNYMIGTFVNSFSSPFASITKFKTLNTQSIDFSFYSRYIEHIRLVKPVDILNTANQYLDTKGLSRSIVGPK